ncbi:MAG: DUF4937 domain-containing protein [bacterium]|nr:DUF4937 domain-containing protein [bacterium]
MLLKWIVCTVKKNLRPEFHEAQVMWKESAAAEGLVAQVGGWDTRNENEACILSVWESQQAYDLFYQYVHDAITTKNHQAGTYEKIEVLFADPVVHMRGELNNLADCAGSASGLRVADCIVKPGRQDHFVDMQLTQWAPAMQQAEGMLGGKFSRVREHDRRFLVTTFWASRRQHENYCEHVLPGCRKRAGVDDDIDSISGRFIHLVPGWNVSG